MLILSSFSIHPSIQQTHLVQLGVCKVPFLVGGNHEHTFIVRCKVGVHLDLLPEDVGDVLDPCLLEHSREQMEIARVDVLPRQDLDRIP